MDRNTKNPRRRRWGLLAVIVLFVLLGLGSLYHLMLASWQGDYLTDARNFNPTRLRSSPWPRWETFWLYGGYYIALPTQCRLYDPHWESRGWEEFLKPEGPLHAIIRHVDGQPEYFYEIDRRPGAFALQTAERYPAGSVDDFLKALEEEDPASMLREARLVQERFPERVTPKYWLVASLIFSGKVEEARRLFEKWREDFRNETYLNDFERMLEHDFSTASPELQEVRREYNELFTLEGGVHLGLEGALEWIVSRRAGEFPQYYSFERGRSFLTQQILVKTGCVWADLELLNGRRDRAHRILLGLSVFSHREREFIERIPVLISAACRTITYLAMTDYYVLGSMAPEELESVWQDLEIYFAADPPQTPLDVYRWFEPEAEEIPPPEDDGFLASLFGSEGVIRWQFSEARRQLLRGGMRSRHYYLLHGDWPAAADDSGLTTDLSPFDPFTTDSLPLRRMHEGADLILYSIGSDGDDDAGDPVYDPTNGTVSNGDIIQRVPARPIYDFPGEPGYVYQGMKDFERRYPEGLPGDPFSNGGLQALKLSLEPTPRVWSWGPDADQPRGAATAPGHPEPLYDPRAGVTSDGDLWVEIDFAEGSVDP